MKLHARRVLAAFVVLAANSWAAAQVMPAPAVPGKEYSNHQDKDALGGGDFLQNVRWDGLGNAVDTFDYSGSGTVITSCRPFPMPAPMDPDQVDALAHPQDFLFQPVVAGAVPFITSLSGNPNIHYHDVAGATGVWATPAMINANAPPDDIDGLEVWGNEQTDDAFHYSTIVDAAGPGVSVYWYNQVAHASGAYICLDQLKAAIGTSLEVDLDALMVHDLQANFVWEPGDSILFSIRQQGPFDGGEIWVWTNGGPAVFLNHGGRIWNTPNPVAAIFGTPTEDIDALEAVLPEPAAVGLMLFGVVLLRRIRSS